MSTHVGNGDLLYLQEGSYQRVLFASRQVVIDLLQIMFQQFIILFFMLY